MKSDKFSQADVLKFEMQQLAHRAQRTAEDIAKDASNIAKALEQDHVTSFKLNASQVQHLLEDLSALRTMSEIVDRLNKED